jgi:hypothetical protein
LHYEYTFKENLLINNLENRKVKRAFFDQETRTLYDETTIVRVRFYLQAKRFGAVDILDPSKCETKEDWDQRF